MCGVDLEDWDGNTLERLVLDNRPRAEELRKWFCGLGEVLAELVDDPADVTLIIPKDFVKAVRLREPAEPYDLERGSREVMGRTMFPERGIDVILKADRMRASDEHGLPIVLQHQMAQIRRTLFHEAQHAIMHQRRSGFDAYGVDAITDENYRQIVEIAANVCDEHRAEWQAVKLTGEPEPPTVVTEALEELAGQLAAARAASDRATPVDNYEGATWTACRHFWVSLGYWAVQLRTDDASIADVPADIVALPLWQQYVGDTWHLLKDSLLSLPVEDLTTRPETLHAAARRVADALVSSRKAIELGYEAG
jgi:hypothetical protein